MPMDSLFRRQSPIVKTRAVHLDLKGVPPAPERLVSLLRVLAAARYNAVLVEWEDMFPWSVDERFRCEAAYTREDVARFTAAAGELGLAVIPLVQCLGHMQTPLSVPGYERLREVPHRADVLNPLAPGARELVEDMIEDVLTAMPDVAHFHLGGDEAWSFGTHPDTKAYIEAHGKDALYLRHVEPILDKLNARGIRPILWHDMMTGWWDKTDGWDSPRLRALAAKADLCVWGYSGHPDTTEYHYNSKYIERFKEHGLTLWGATAYKGADGHNVDLPNPARRQENALAWAEVAERYEMVGLIATAWSRYNTHAVQCEPVDGALDSLVNVGVILHDGRAPDGGIDACAAALGELGERERFEACKAGLQKLAAARSACWTSIAHAREQVVMMALDSRRKGGGGDRLRTLNARIAKAEEAAGEVEKALAGCIDPIWIERYLAERIEPLREERDGLVERVRQLDPEGFEALSENP